MLKVENELVEKMVQTDQDFRKLFEAHISFEQDLEALYSLKYFPPEVEAKIKEIKISKLRGKDKMEMLLAQKKSENNK
ncbi:conserved hypothetical protein [Denitrovibrio acetiphilus DSM 12809]|uniref:DUF465 domain-containing protein n=1 Tax=Denitrovibrio acetiphilus (strain DSM 12809 / NBRC 114555 / N2460) TaxID=522772 RepID=D4H864_DENA2|nr:hypothetical protein [Denitrovibrio acetiphilus]ADD68213.1 conserved hypothetical protein [Denitrovibrio acetiphilus DSM 12809]